MLDTRHNSNDHFPRVFTLYVFLPFYFPLIDWFACPCFPRPSYQFPSFPCRIPLFISFFYFLLYLLFPCILILPIRFPFPIPFIKVINFIIIFLFDSRCAWGLVFPHPRTQQFWRSQAISNLFLFY